MSRDKWDKFRRQSKVRIYDPILDFKPKHKKKNLRKALQALKR